MGTLALRWGEDSSRNTTEMVLQVTGISRSGADLNSHSPENMGATTIFLAGGSTFVVGDERAVLYNSNGTIMKALVKVGVPQPSQEESEQLSGPSEEEGALQFLGVRRLEPKPGGLFGKPKQTGFAPAMLPNGPPPAPIGPPSSFMDAYCRYGCGGMSVTFPYYYRPFFGYGYPLVGTEAMFPQGYGGYPAAPLLASQGGSPAIMGASGPVLAGGVPATALAATMKLSPTAHFSSMKHTRVSVCERHMLQITAASSSTSSGAVATPLTEGNKKTRSDLPSDPTTNSKATSGQEEDLWDAESSQKAPASSHQENNATDGSASPQPLSAAVEQKETKDVDSYSESDPAHNDNLLKDSQGDNGNPLIVVDKEFVCNYPHGGCSESPSDYWYMTSGVLSACRQVVPLGRYRWLLVLDLGCAKRQLPHLQIPPVSVRRSAFAKNNSRGYDRKGTEARQDEPDVRETKIDNAERTKAHPKANDLEEKDGNRRLPSLPPLPALSELLEDCKETSNQRETKDDGEGSGAATTNSGLPKAEIRTNNRGSGEKKRPWFAPQFSLFPESDCNHNGLVDVRCAVDCGWQPRIGSQQTPDEVGGRQDATSTSADATGTPPRKTLRCLFQYDKEGLWGMRQEHVGSCFVIDGGCKSPFEERHRIFCTGWRGQGAGFDPRDPPLPLSSDSVSLCTEDDCRDCNAFLHPQTGLVTRGCPNATWKEEGTFGPACYGRIFPSSPPQGAGRHGTKAELKPSQAKPTATRLEDGLGSRFGATSMGAEEERTANESRTRQVEAGESSTDEPHRWAVQKDERHDSGGGGAEEISALPAVSDEEVDEKDRMEGPVARSSHPGVPLPRSIDRWEVPSYPNGSPAASCYKTRVFQVFIQKHGRGRECIETEGSVHFAGCAESDGCAEAFGAVASQFQSLVDSVLHEREAGLAGLTTLRGGEEAVLKKRLRQGSTEGDTQDEDATTQEVLFASGQAGDGGRMPNAPSKETGEADPHQNRQRTANVPQSLSDEEEAERLLESGVCPGRWSSWTHCETDCYARRFFTLASSPFAPPHCLRAAAAMELTQCSKAPPLCGSVLSQRADGLSGSAGEKDTTRTEWKPTLGEEEPGTREAVMDEGDATESSVSNEDRAQGKDLPFRWLEIHIRPDGTMGAFDRDGHRAPVLMVSHDYKGRCGIAVGEWSSCDGLCRRFRLLSLRSLHKDDRAEDGACPSQTPLTRERALCEEPTVASVKVSNAFQQQQNHQKSASVQSGPSEPRDTGKLWSCADPLVVVADLKVSVLLDAPGGSASDSLWANDLETKTDSSRPVKDQERTGNLEEALFQLSFVRTLARFLGLQPSALIIEQLNPEYAEQRAKNDASFPKTVHENIEEDAGVPPHSGPPQTPGSTDRNASKENVLQVSQTDSLGQQNAEAKGELKTAIEARDSPVRLLEETPGSGEETGRTTILPANGKLSWSSAERLLSSSKKEDAKHSRSRRRQLADKEQASDSASQAADGGDKTAEVSRATEQNLHFRLRILTPAFARAMRALGLTEKDRKMRKTQTSLLSGGGGSRLYDEEERANGKKRRAADIMDDLEALQGRVFRLPGPLDAHVEIVRVTDKTSNLRKGFGDPSLLDGSVSAFPSSLAFLGLADVRPRPGPVGSWGLTATAPVYFVDPLFELSPLVLYVVVFCMACGGMLFLLALCACVRDRWRKQAQAGREANVELSRGRGACGLAPNRIGHSPPLGRDMPLWPQPCADGQNMEHSRPIPMRDGASGPSKGYLSNPKYSVHSGRVERQQKSPAPATPIPFLSAGLEPTLMGKPAFQNAERRDGKSTGRPSGVRFSKGSSTVLRGNDSVRAPGSTTVQGETAPRSGDAHAEKSGDRGGACGTDTAPGIKGSGEDSQQRTSHLSLLKRLRNWGGTSREGSYKRFSQPTTPEGEAQRESEGGCGKALAESRERHLRT
ncbi:conserved hypothetical protein [Neospora caninum Liverpool]|uniref:Transmembrane protein n=1 Tax=Neospora caninum (strain Liverpool) TaxID=572307 RepID=F0VFT6_NEOCL|nr:conserved hypothetical protein [Neospora caninum Liverpool]CBZ52580.1 conserved hypothetical protein [Neospora caninum Liverpool]|eukprot:XP_003882612.1 conserved hypothetical protein [Neospora caninum Liverpool]